MSALLFRPIVVVFQDHKFVLRPYESSHDRHFTDGAYAPNEYVQIRGLDPSRIEAKLPFVVPSDAVVFIDRDIVGYKGSLHRRPAPEPVAWDTPVRAGDRVEFRTRNDEEEAEETAEQISSNLFRRDNGLWHIRFTAGSKTEEEGRFPGLKGLRHIALLLSHPGQLLECMDIDPRSRALGDGDMSFQETIDDQARTDLLSRIRELEEAAEIANDTGNEERLAIIVQELCELQEEKAKALNWKGKARSLGGSSLAVQAYHRVKRNLGTACAKIGKKMPQCSQFLHSSIRPNGTAYIYRPAVDIEWEL